MNGVSSIYYKSPPLFQEGDAVQVPIQCLEPEWGAKCFD